MLLRHGQVNYLLGLEWIELEGGSPSQYLRELLGKDATAFYQTLGPRREGQLIGFTRDVSDLAQPAKKQGKGKGKAKNKTYSLAAMLATRGENGIYFLEFGAQGWYAVVQDGQLMRAGGEMLMPVAHAVDAVTQLSQALELPVFSSSSFFESASAFSVSDLDNMRRKPAPMVELKQGGGTSQALGALMLLAVFSAILYAGWYFVIRTPTPKVSQAQLAEQARQSYAQTVLGSMPQLDVDPAWIVDGARLTSTDYPDNVSGWVLDTVTCTPMQCGANYVISDDHTTFSLHELNQRFGEQRVRLGETMRRVLVTHDREWQPDAWSVEQVLAPEATDVNLVDVHGVLRLRAPAVEVEQTMHSESLSQGMQPPAVPGIVRETIRTSGHDAYPAAAFARLAAILGPMGFSPESMELRVSAAGREAGWQVSWVRLNREQT